MQMLRVIYMTLARDPCIWLLPSQLNLQNWVDWAPLHNFAKSATFSKCQRSVMSACDVSRDFFYSYWASPIGYLVVFVLLLGWPFYNFKSSKPNGSASLFERRRNRKLLVWTFSYLIKALYFVIAMARPHACWSPRWNPSSVKRIINEPAE